MAFSLMKFLRFSFARRVHWKTLPVTGPGAAGPRADRGQQAAQRSTCWVQSSRGMTACSSSPSEPVVTLCSVFQGPCVTECPSGVHVFSTGVRVSAQECQPKSPAARWAPARVQLSTRASEAHALPHLTTSHCVTCMNMTGDGLCTPRF